MIHVEISDSIINSAPASHLELLEKAASKAMEFVHIQADTELTIVLSDDDQLQELNRQFLLIDEPTDVLSFPAELTDPDTNAPYLGDIIISYQRAQVQAAAGSHAIEDELHLLAVHGVLHLCGYDHAGDEEKAEMWAVQAKILAQLGSTCFPS
jgi:probable rRNA maturation factor